MPTLEQLVKDVLRRLRGKNQEPPEDPYSYAGAPKKPRPPHFNAAAAVERPED